VRATLEAIAFEVRDVVELLPHITTLRVDGGAAANSLLLQLQADTLSMPVERPEVLETTGLGAAFLAGLGTGVWSSTEELAATWRLDTRFEPAERPEHATTYERWRAAVERAKGWDVG
jgi:glycerol kinase